MGVALLSNVLQRGGSVGGGGELRNTVLVGEVDVSVEVPERRSSDMANSHDGAEQGNQFVVHGWGDWMVRIESWNRSGANGFK